MWQKEFCRGTFLVNILSVTDSYKWLRKVPLNQGFLKINQSGSTAKIVLEQQKDKLPLTGIEPGIVGLL